MFPECRKPVQVHDLILSMTLEGRYYHSPFHRLTNTSSKRRNQPKVKITKCQILVQAFWPKLLPHHILMLELRRSISLTVPICPEFPRELHICQSAFYCKQRPSSLIYCCWLVTESCPTLFNPTDCSLPGSSVHEISQAGILEWVAISSSRKSSWLRDRKCISCIGRRILYHWATLGSPLPHSLSAWIPVFILQWLIIHFWP